MKRILIYAHYYVPDVASTGQILQDLAEGMTDEFDVTVICTVPSYMGTIEERYKKKKFYREKLNGVNLIHVPVPEFSKTSKISRIKNIIAYYVNARKATRLVGNQDYVFAISQPPILGGMLGVYGKNHIRTSNGDRPKFIYNIQDFNPEQIKAVGYIKNRLFLLIALWLDKRSCRKSDLVITVGRDLVETLKNRFEHSAIPKHVMINNWIDDDAVYPLESDDQGVVEFKKKYGLTDKFVFMYSGNLGLYYDLEGLFGVIEKFKNAKTKTGKDVVFAFVGAGSLLEQLIKYRDDHDMGNVVFIPYQDKSKLIYSLNAADVHLCVNAKGIKGVSVPSKIYGIISVGKPILAVLENKSEAEMLIFDSKCGIVSEPEEYDAFEENLNYFISEILQEDLLEMGAKGREYLKRKLRKRNAVNAYISGIKGL